MLPKSVYYFKSINNKQGEIVCNITCNAHNVSHKMIFLYNTLNAHTQIFKCTTTLIYTYSRYYYSVFLKYASMNHFWCKKGKCSGTVSTIYFYVFQEIFWVPLESYAWTNEIRDCTGYSQTLVKHPYIFHTFVVSSFILTWVTWFQYRFFNIGVILWTWTM